MKKNLKKKKNVFERNKINIKHMTRYSSINFNHIKKKLDHLIYFGYKKGFVYNSYKTFKDKIDIQPCISDNIKIKKKNSSKKYIKKFYILFWIKDFFIKV